MQLQCIHTSEQANLESVIKYGRCFSSHCLSGWILPLKQGELGKYLLYRKIPEDIQNS